MFDYLQKEVDDTGRTKWDAILEDSKGKDIAVMMGILTEKFLLTQGQPPTLWPIKSRKPWMSWPWLLSGRLSVGTW